MSKITSKQMAVYRKTAKQRQEQRESERKERHARTWQTAQRAGQLLRASFGAQKVVAFGSVCSPDRFHHLSDLDLAVWGLDEKLYYRAVSHLLDLDTEISIDLIEAETASQTLLDQINQGVAV